MNRRDLLLGAGGVAGVGGISWALLRNPSQDSSQLIRILGEDSSNLQAISAHLQKDGNNRNFPNAVEATDFTTASEKALAAFAQGSSVPDIVLGYNFSLSPYVRNHYVYTIEELKQYRAASTKLDFESDILPNVWKELGYYAKPPFRELSQAEPIAYPFCANTMLLVYDVKVFEDSRVASAYRARFGHDFAPPSSWEEFAEVARLVKAARPDFSGVALQGAPDGWLYYEWMNFLFGMGGSVMDKSYGWQSDATTPLTLRTVEAVKAAELYCALKPVNAGDFFTTDAARQRDIMKERKTAFAIMWTDYIPDLAKLDGFGFAPIPGPRSMIAGGSFFVNRKTKSPGAALSLIAHLQSVPVQKELALAGLFPATRSALSEPQVLAKPYMPAVRTSLERGTYMLEASVDSTLISEKITKALQRAWRGDIAPSQVGEEAAKEITEDRVRL